MQEGRPAGAGRRREHERLRVRLLQGMLAVLTFVRQRAVLRVAYPSLSVRRTYRFRLVGDRPRRKSLHRQLAARHRWRPTWACHFLVECRSIRCWRAPATRARTLCSSAPLLLPCLRSNPLSARCVASSATPIRKRRNTVSHTHACMHTRAYNKVSASVLVVMGRSCLVKELQTLAVHKAVLKVPPHSYRAK